MRALVVIVAMFTGSACAADTIIAARNIRPQTILSEDDISIKSGTTLGAFADPTAVIGQETRSTLYAGRPIKSEDIGPPAIIDRNQIVIMAYSVGSLTITTEARALGRGGVGDVVRLLNLTSRATVEGRIRPDGTVLVQ